MVCLKKKTHMPDLRTTKAHSWLASSPRLPAPDPDVSCGGRPRGRPALSCEPLSLLFLCVSSLEMLSLSRLAFCFYCDFPEETAHSTGL